MNSIVQMLAFDVCFGTAVKHTLFITTTLTLYDYLLMFDDEIRYVWKGRKSLITYLYISNRILLVGYQIGLIYFITGNPASSMISSKSIPLLGCWHPRLAVFCRRLRPSVFGVFFLFFFGHLHNVEDICDNFKKQGTHGVPLDSGVGKIGRRARDGSPLPFGDQPQIGSDFDRHRVRLCRIHHRHLVHLS
ncbi:hypothetical protein BDM02DRAFT_979028 [Thelephora ganbajun]|uniref:Uncharacterized protein n=1 Tax=Thelephora ganbajun TaxID=370292 RepID=A0ACB6ZNG0_THEGA|nr:hypothetical protein BDM02DRAFT_979028 [Thelephora ganbajun]